MDEALSDLVRRRAGFRCEYCRVPQALARSSFEIDHVIARKHRGPTEPGNLALACFDCNSNKGPNIAGIDPASGTITPLFHPRRHPWKRCFRWDGPVLVGRTPIGRTTIAVLEINLPLRVIFRQTLIDEGVFPAE